MGMRNDLGTKEKGGETNNQNDAFISWDFFSENP